MALNFQPIYVLATGGSRAIEELDAINNNIANVNTTGFKKLLIKEMSQRIDKNGGDSNHLFVYPRFEDSLVINTQGSIKKSDSPFDFAIQGEGYFAIKTKSGELLTRNGHFFVNGNGVLVDAMGNEVLDEQNKKIVLDSKKRVDVAKDGSIFQDGEKVAKLKIVANDKLKAVGNSYYKGTGKSVKPNFEVLQGFLESSNINPIEEMSDMIVAQRRFDIYTNLMKSLDRLEEKTNEIGKA